MRVADFVSSLITHLCLQCVDFESKLDSLHCFVELHVHTLNFISGTVCELYIANVCIMHNNITCHVHYLSLIGLAVKFP